MLDLSLLDAISYPKVLVDWVAQPLVMDLRLFAQASSNVCSVWPNIDANKAAKLCCLFGSVEDVSGALLDYNSPLPHFCIFCCLMVTPLLSWSFGLWNYHKQYPN